MKTNIFPAIKLTLLCLIFFSGIYTCAVWGIAQLGPNHGKGEVIAQNGKYYYANIGQSFTQDQYFWSRPSAVGYNAAGSGGSNKGPSNPDYLAEVQGRIDTFLVHNPGISKAEIPADLVTASGSGLDPDISVQAAEVQIPRIAAVRGLSVDQLKGIVSECTERPLMGILGTQKVNVLQLNLALDRLVTK
jgi:potassium-transporting ATPase KdpC subunit